MHCKVSGIVPKLCSVLYNVVGKCDASRIIQMTYLLKNGILEIT